MVSRCAVVISVAVLALTRGASAAPSDAISLAGSWRFASSADALASTAQTIFLPGSTDQAGYGTRSSGPEKGWLSRPYIWDGPAWYETVAAIPESWRGRRVTLFLERVHWQSEVWVDGKSFGLQNSLATAHEYDLTTALPPGRHTIRLCIDNTYRINVGRNAHSVTDHTQTNWNGVVGRIELRATSPVWIDAVRLFPSASARNIRVEATLGNATGTKVSGEVRAAVPGARATAAPFTFEGREQKIEFTVPAARDAGWWDEWSGLVYPIELTLNAGPRFTHAWRGTFGLRDIATRGTQFTLNGRPVFLRGTLECNIFPLTGYPPTDEASWDRLFRIARSYGLNHFRFHSACPPEAAFAAADRAGFLLQVELPVWTQAKENDAGVFEFMRAEGRRMLRAYGNHPSFTMLCLGNEFRGNFDVLDKILSEFKAYDRRPLYTFSSDHTGTPPGPNADYYVAQRTPAGPMRIHGQRFDKQPPSTDFDFGQQVAAVKVPIVAHELGQWAVFPDYSEIARYTGVLKPRNLEAFREQLAARGMIDQAADFQKASGAFAWRLYKEEMETALRTSGYGGFQLLQLEDFPGQGEALVGLLDSFWESKGIVTPADFREACNRTVPLLRLPKFVWTAAETFEAKAELAHYGPEEWDAAATWSVRAEPGRELASGRFASRRVAPGEVAPLGAIRAPLANLESAAKLRIAVEAGTGAHNEWDVWVYPANGDDAVPPGVTVTQDYKAARAALQAGGKVLLIWPPQRESESTLPTHFLPVFWSLSWFAKQPGTLGVLCDPKHPALAGFPTDMHSDYQWWEVTQNSRAFILDETPAGYRPIVQPVDDFHRNHKLGAIFETRAGTGKLLVCSLDIGSGLERRPVARQLRRSLLAYMAGERFAPEATFDAALLDKLFHHR